MERKIEYIMQDFNPFKILCKYPPISQFIFQPTNSFSIQLKNAMKILYELRILIKWSDATKMDSPVIIDNDKIKKYIHNMSSDSGHELLCATMSVVIHLFNKRKMPETNRFKCMQTIAAYSNQEMTSADWYNIENFYYNEILEWNRDERINASKYLFYFSD